VKITYLQNYFVILLDTGTYLHNLNFMKPFDLLTTQLASPSWN